MRWLALVAVLAPLASAQAFTPFVGGMSDRADDVVTRAFDPYEAPSTDILNFSSRALEGTRIEQRVAMAAAPDFAKNSIIVRSWFRNSTGGSFYTLDLEVHSEAEGLDAFVAYTRRGDFANVTQVNATWALEGSEWVFTFDANEAAPDATCFLPQVYAYLSGPEGSGAFDSVGMTGRPCATSPEPGNARPGSNTPRFPPIVAGMPDATPAPIEEPTVEPPGSRTPTPGLSFPLALMGVLAATTLIAPTGRLRRP